MGQIRTWLDANKIQPLIFQSIEIHGGTAFELRFQSEDEARRFEQEFCRRIEN
jgi:hypothetical protein